VKDPFYYKNNIPIFVKKTEAQVRADKYEHYFPVVQRNLLLHTGDQIFGRAFYAPIIQFVMDCIPGGNQIILDVGCGVGRLSADVGKALPDCQIFGIDYSLQMLKMANRLWKENLEIEINGSDQGFEPYTHLGQSIKNITFMQASADFLPWETNQVDVIIAVFLLDKVFDPMAVLAEFKRVLKKTGHCLIFIPFNFQKRELWKDLYPPDRFIDQCNNAGFRLHKKKKIKITEPLDRHGNVVLWNTIALFFEA
jgi:SAM-dependent methyltransferase